MLAPSASSSDGRLPRRRRRRSRGRRRWRSIARRPWRVLGSSTGPRGRRRRGGKRSLPGPLPRAAALIVVNGSVMCMAGFPGVAPRAVFFPSVVKPKMLLLGRYAPEGQCSVAFAWLVLLVMLPSRCVPFYCRQAVWCISWTSSSRPSLCNDRFWSRQCSVLPVETPQAQFLDEFMVT